MKNAMANPRKFSEKIALIKQKEAEGDAAFQQIISEVSAVTKDPTVSVPFRKQLPQLYATYKAGSLPDINQSATVHSQNPASIDLKGALDEFNLLNSRETASPRQQPRRQNVHGYAPAAAASSSASVPRSARCRTVEPPVPYPPYLSPPQQLPGPEWRRFKSDSDIHERLKQQPSAGSQQHQQSSAGVVQQQQQSAQQPSPGDPGGLGSGNGTVMSPLMHRRVLEVGNSSLMPGDHMKAYGGRPKSCGEYPGVMNNNLPYPSSDVLMNGGHHQPAVLSVAGPGAAGVSQMPGSPGSSGGNPATPPSLSNNYGSLPDLTNIQLSPSPAGAQTAADLASGGGMGGRYVNTSMPPPDSPSQLRHNPFAGSPTHKQTMASVVWQEPCDDGSILARRDVNRHVGCGGGFVVTMPPHGLLQPMNLNLPYSFPSVPAAAAASSGTSAVSPTGASMGKQFINETIRKRISDKRLAQASLNPFRNSQGEACSSPVSPHTPPVCSPDGAGSSTSNSPAPHDFFPHMYYSLSPPVQMPQQQQQHPQQQHPQQQQQQSSPLHHQLHHHHHHHQLPSPHSPLPQVQSSAVLQQSGGPISPSMPLPSMQHQLRQHPSQAGPAHPMSFDPYKLDAQQQRHQTTAGLGGFTSMAVPPVGSGGGGMGQYAGNASAAMSGCLPPMYGGGDVGLGYQSTNSNDLLGIGGSASVTGSGGIAVGHLLIGDGHLRNAGTVHKSRIPNIVLTGADDSVRHDCCPVFQESFDSNDLFPTDEQFKAELAPLDFEGLQMLDDPSSLVTDPNTEDQLRLG